MTTPKRKADNDNDNNDSHNKKGKKLSKQEKLQALERARQWGEKQSQTSDVSGLPRIAVPTKGTTGNSNGTATTDRTTAPKSTENSKLSKKAQLKRAVAWAAENRTSRGELSTSSTIKTPPSLTPPSPKKSKKPVSINGQKGPVLVTKSSIQKKKTRIETKKISGVEKQQVADKIVKQWKKYLFLFILLLAVACGALYLHVQKAAKTDTGMKFSPGMEEISTEDVTESHHNESLPETTNEHDYNVNVEENEIHGQENFTPDQIRFASSRGDLNLLSQIVAARPDLMDDTDVNGWCAIHEAARAGQFDAVRILVEAGCDSNIRTGTESNEMSPLDIASITFGNEHRGTIYLQSLENKE